MLVFHPLIVTTIWIFHQLLHTYCTRFIHLRGYQFVIDIRSLSINHVYISHMIDHFISYFTEDCPEFDSIKVTRSISKVLTKRGTLLLRGIAMHLIR